MGSMSGVVLSLKKSESAVVILGSRVRSVSKEEFSLQVFDLGVGVHMSIGAWS